MQHVVMVNSVGEKITVATERERERERERWENASIGTEKQK